MSNASAIQLYDAHGARKYLTSGELGRFLTAAKRAPEDTALFCQLVALTGCRASEALALTLASLDVETCRVTFRTLKRRKLAYRAVPLAPGLLIALVQLGLTRPPQARIWACCRQTAWRRVKAVMAEADISGPQATLKGLRHGFAVANAEAAIPMTMTQRWLGHADIATTAIYQQAVGREERAFAERLWARLET